MSVYDYLDLIQDYLKRSLDVRDNEDQINSEKENEEIIDKKKYEYEKGEVIII